MRWVNVELNHPTAYQPFVGACWLLLQVCSVQGIQRIVRSDAWPKICCHSSVYVAKLPISSMPCERVDETVHDSLLITEMWSRVSCEANSRRGVRERSWSCRKSPLLSPTRIGLSSSIPLSPATKQPLVGSEELRFWLLCCRCDLTLQSTWVPIKLTRVNICAPHCSLLPIGCFIRQCLVSAAVKLFRSLVSSLCAYVRRNTKTEKEAQNALASQTETGSTIH